MSTGARKRTLGEIARFWMPLEATWLMMAVEGPLIAAIIARLVQPKFNLAAYGIAFAIALIVEAPIIMMLTAATALIRDRLSYQRLRNFTQMLNGLITLVMLVFIIPDVFQRFSVDLMNLPPQVARLTHGSLMILLPWPGAIGYRRFYQGLLIQYSRTRYVAFGTLIRLMIMASTAIVLFIDGRLPGAYVGAISLSLGVTGEAVAIRIMAQRSVRRIVALGVDQQALSYREIAAFYYPLALTSLIGLAVQPVLTFFMGRALFPLDSLAVFPVIMTFLFIFRTLGLANQEVTIALIGDRLENYRPLRQFAVMLGLSSLIGLTLFSFTPLSSLWFSTVGGLSSDLVEFCKSPLMWMTPIPAMTVLLSWQRSILVVRKNTGPITWASFIEVTTVVVIMFLLVRHSSWPGASAAAFALLLGRMGSCAYLGLKGVRLKAEGG